MRYPTRIAPCDPVAGNHDKPVVEEEEEEVVCIVEVVCRVEVVC